MKFVWAVIQYLSAPRTQALACVFIIVLGFGVLFNLPRADALTITPRLELNADPGSVIQAIVKVSNEQRESKTVYLKFANFNSEDESGTPSFSERQEDLAIWMEAAASVTVGPGETKQVPVRISIPKDATPGGHFAAIFFLSNPPTATSNEVAISSELGSLVLLRVNGDFQQDAFVVGSGAVGHKWGQS